DVARAARGSGEGAGPAAIALAAAPAGLPREVERDALPAARARRALAPGRGPDRVLVAPAQAGFFAFFFPLPGRVLPCDPLKPLPRKVRLSPLPIRCSQNDNRGAYNTRPHVRRDQVPYHRAAHARSREDRSAPAGVDHLARAPQAGAARRLLLADRDAARAPAEAGATAGGDGTARGHAALRLGGPRDRRLGVHQFQSASGREAAHRGEDTRRRGE